MKYTIGYIDEEDQFIAKFRGKLKDAFDIVTFDLTADTTLDEIIANIEAAELDCLIVDYELKEAAVIQFNGDEIIDAYRKKYPFFPVFIITSKKEEDVLDEVEDGDIVRLKDELNDKPGILIQRISNKIDLYYSDIADAEKTIEGLVDKKAQEDLSVSEEELLTEKYIYLDKIYPEGKVLPENWQQKGSITKFNEFASDAKEILEALKNLKNG